MSGAIKTKKVKTRKEHKCWGCGRKFEKGTEMQTVVWVEDGRISTHYWCDTCVKYWGEYMDFDDRIDIGELKHMEGWDELKKELEGEVNNERD